MNKELIKAILGIPGIICLVFGIGYNNGWLGWFGIACLITLGGLWAVGVMEE